MKLEQQVVSLELAKKLKELGVKQESLFWWDLLRDQVRKNYGIIPTQYRNRFISAFTVAELGEMLPKDKMTFVNWFDSGWRVDYGEDRSAKNNTREGVHSLDTNLANAIAKLLVHLLENKLINKS